MPFLEYEEHNFRKSNLDLIDKVNDIINTYTAQGYSLTLRQIYYQLVSRDIIENSQKSYKNIGNIISDGRMSGHIDWTAIEDRTRNIRALPRWDNPTHFLESVTPQYHIDLWEDHVSSKIKCTNSRHIECTNPRHKMYQINHGRYNFHKE